MYISGMCRVVFLQCSKTDCSLAFPLQISSQPNPNYNQGSATRSKPLRVGALLITKHVKRKLCK